MERKLAQEKKREINDLYESYGANKPFPSPGRRKVKKRVGGGHMVKPGEEPLLVSYDAT